MAARRRGALAFIHHIRRSHFRPRYHALRGNARRTLRVLLLAARPALRFLSVHAREEWIAQPGPHCLRLFAISLRDPGNAQDATAARIRTWPTLHPGLGRGRGASGVRYHAERGNEMADERPTEKTSPRTPIIRSPSWTYTERQRNNKVSIKAGLLTEIEFPLKNHPPQTLEAFRNRQV